MDFPDEIVVEILRRLPVKSLVRFRCVSKSWRCLISDPTFVRAHLESHMAHISFGTASRIALSRKSDTLLSLQAYENGGGDSYGFAVAEELHLDLVKNSNYYVQAHCDGLLCLLIYNEEKSLLVVYNPSIREHRILPVPFPRHYICTPKSVGVGYDPSTDDYKIVRVPSTVEANLCKKRGTIPRVEIYTLKSKSNSWRSLPLEDTPPHGAHIMSQPANAHGGLYWLCRDNASSDRHVILRFDLVEEKFRVVPLPPPVPGEPQYLRWLGSLKDLLSVICFQKATASHFHIWSTKDDKTWTKLITIPTLQGPKPFLYSCQYEPFCYTKSGALLMYIREGEVGFVMYEPGESRFRKLEVRGVENYIHRTLYCESLVSPNCWNEQ